MPLQQDVFTGADQWETRGVQEEFPDIVSILSNNLG